MAWLPIPLLLTLVLALWAANLPTEHESQFLLSVLNFLCSTVASLLVAVLVGRSYLVRPSPGLLFFGCGVAIWGAAGTLVPVLFPHGLNALTSGHNSLVWFAALCHLTGVRLSLISWKQPRLPGLSLAVAYAGALCFVWLVAMLAVEGWMPEFFVQGRGGTPLRTFVLGTAAGMFALSAAVLWRANRPSPSAFVRWYGAALLLVATGLLGIMLETVQGGALSWAGRAAQFLGGAYMLVAAFASARESGARSLSLSAALRQSDERLRLQMERMPIGCIVHDEHNCFIQLNPAAERIFGYSQGELLGKRANTIVPEAARSHVDDILRRLAEGDMTAHSVNENVTKDGRTIICEWTNTPLRDPDGRFVGVLSMVQDVTERKRAEEKLRASEDRFRTIAEALPILVSITDAADSMVLFTNKAHNEAFGYRNEEILGLKGPDYFCDPADRVKLLEAVRQRGFVENLSVHVKRKDGSAFWILASVRPISYNGKLAVIAASIDNTRLKQAEEALRASEEKYRSLFENIEEMVTVYEVERDGNGQIVERRLRDANQAFLRAVGVSSINEIRGKTSSQVFGKAWSDLHLPAVQRCMDTGQVQVQEVHRPESGRHYITTVVRLDAQTYLGTGWDITARKRAEEERNQLAEHRQMALDAARMVAWEYDPVTGKVTFSDNAEEILGLPGGKRLENSDEGYKLIHPDDVEHHRALVTEAIATGGRYVSIFRHSHGSEVIWLEERGRAVVDQAGKTIRLVGIVQNITERKQAEAALAKARVETEQRAAELQAVLDTAQVAVWIAHDPQCLRITGNKYADELIMRVSRGANISASALPGEAAVTFRVFRNSVELKPEELPAQVAAATGRPVADEVLELRFSDGRSVYLLEGAVPLFDGEGHTRGSVATAMDITPMRKAEETLREAKERVEAHLSNSPLAIIEFDADFRVVRWSGAAEQVFGWKAEDIVGKAIAEMRWVHADDVAAVVQVSDDMRTGRRPRNLNVNRNYHKDGRIIHCEWYNSAIYDTQGRLRSVFSQVLDITDRKRAEAAVRESEERFRSVAENKSEGLMMFDPQGNVIYQNPASLRIHGYSDQQDGRIPHENLPATWQGWDKQGQPLPLDQWPISRVLRGERIENQVLHARRSDMGLEFDASYNGCPIRDIDGKTVLGFITIREITEQRKAEVALRESVKELARSNKDLEQFAYISAHDLQEPLRQVRAFVSMLKDRHADKFDGKAAEYFSYVYDGAARMSELVRGLLDYSRVGLREARHEPTPCQRALDTALSNLQASIVESHASITHDELPTVVAEPTQLAQLFQNLIGNAIKFRREGVTPEIHIGVKKGSGFRGQGSGAEREIARPPVAEPPFLPEPRTLTPDIWLFSVKDNGIGIAPEFYEKVFVIFQRLHGREKYAGTGIGLAICKKIVEQHGGKIWIESKVEQGSTFCFSLPGEVTDDG